jgi:S-adenosylmethionine-diacylglycerol 3-amino-3-carboxypropyl transferase
MSVKSQDQVELFDLLFGMSWEDPSSDRRALAIQPGETLLTVTSGACNTLTLLLEDPGKVYAVDINPSQSYLLELKCAAVRHLDYNELRAFLGLAPSDQRLQVFERLRGDLTGAALRYWTGNAEALRTGVVTAGKYESFIRLFSRVLGVLQGKERIEGLFRCETLAQQQDYFERKWNTLQWRLLFKLFANKRVLARRGLTADYFKFDDGSSSFSESFLRRARRAICEIPVESNYFLAQYLLARYRSEEAVPAYLLRGNLPIVRQRLDRIEIVTSDAQSWLGRQPNSSIDAFSLSNICELMSPDETGRLFAAVTGAARAGARVCFRNLMVPRGVPETLASEIELNEELSRQLIAEDRSLVYSRVQAFVVHSRSRSDYRPVMTG